MINHILISVSKMIELGVFCKLFHEDEVRLYDVSIYCWHLKPRPVCV